MSRITIRIEADAHSPGDFQVVLIEDDGTSTTALLPAASLICDAGAGNRMDPANIVARVSGADAMARQSPEFSLIGAAMYAWMFPAGPLRQRWTALQQAQQISVTLDIRDPNLAALPWEMASSPPPQIRVSSAGAMQRSETPIIRQCQCSAWPFRILFVVGCSEQEAVRLSIDQELEIVERTFVPLGRSVDVNSLLRPSKSALREYVREFHPHVMHFAGHGGVDGQNPALLFDAAAGAWPWSIAQIAGDLAGWQWTPAFVFLNACRSGFGAQSSWSVQRTFMSAGVKGSVGMQADIDGKLAGAFAAKVYQELARGSTVEQAAFEGRLVLGGRSDPDWWIPVLISTVSDAKLFEADPLPADPEFEQCLEFEHAKYFADCKEGRRKLTYWLKPPAQPAQNAAPKNVIVLDGEGRSGKSHLVKWCMESWTLAGARVRYIEVHKSSAKTFLSILRQIRDGDAEDKNELKLLHAGLPEQAFRRFNWELKNFIDTGKAGEWNEARDGGGNVGDDDRPLTARGELRIEAGICASFLSALQLTATARPLILVFDRLTGASGERLIPQSEFQHLVQNVFRPIAVDAASKVRLVFVVNRGQQTDFGLYALPPANVLAWTLPANYTPEQLAQLAAEMLWFPEKEEARVKQLTESVLSFDPEYGAPVGLALLEDVYAVIKRRAARLLAGVTRMR